MLITQTRGKAQARRLSCSLGLPLGRDGRVAGDAKLRHEAVHDAEELDVGEEVALHQLLKARSAGRGPAWLCRREGMIDEATVCK